MAKGNLTVTDGRKVVTTAGTRVAMAAAPTPVAGTTTVTATSYSSVDITAETDNTGIVVVGGSTVIAALATRQGTPLNAGDTVTFCNVDLANVWLDSTVNGDGVTWSGTTT